MTVATIIQTSENGFIVGDPADHLEADEHWCSYCAGTGLEYGYEYDDELQVCLRCDGSGVVNCDDPDCIEHSGSVLNDRQLDGRACVRCGAESTSMRPVGFRSRGQLFECTEHQN